MMADHKTSKTLSGIIKKGRLITRNTVIFSSKCNRWGLWLQFSHGVKEANQLMLGIFLNVLGDVEKYTITHRVRKRMVDKDECIMQVPQYSSTSANQRQYTIGQQYESRSNRM